jgi:uncharacterized damage-inducible protein DinB
MVSGPSLKQQLDQKVQEIKQAVSGVSEEKASKRPGEGEWSVKEVLSHLSGGESDDFANLKRVIHEDTPLVEFEIGVSHYEGRENMSAAELTSKVESTYGEMGDFLSGLSEEQLNRKAHAPQLKEMPMGEYPTLGQLSLALINFHLNDHINHLRNLGQQ